MRKQLLYEWLSNNSIMINDTTEKIDPQNTKRLMYNGQLIGIILNDSLNNKPIYLHLQL